MYRVGIDLTAIDDVRESLERFGVGYLMRIFSPAEGRECGSNPARLAEMFAVKEATMKALGRRDEGVDWKSIQVSGVSSAQPRVALTGQAAALGRARGLTRLTVSVSHDRIHATALVVAEGRS